MLEDPSALGLSARYGSEHDFWEDLDGGRRLEQERLELKGGPSDDLNAVLPAMAMTDGGLVFLGIQDDRTIIGCRLTQRVLDRIGRSSHATGIDVSVCEVSIGGTTVVAVGVPRIRGRVVTTPDGRLLRRVGSDNQPLVGDQLARFVIAQGSAPAEDEVVAGLHEEHFDGQLLERGLRAARRGQESDYDSRFRAMEELGLARRIQGHTQPTVAGVVCLSTDPTAHIPGARVQVIRRSGVGPELSPTRWRRQLTGPLAHLVDQVWELLDEEVEGHEAVVGRHRERLPAYPEAAIREALTNALGHRDYTLVGATVDVTVWDDRVQVQSPGSLPGHITLENMAVEHYSRNPHVMGFLKLLDLVEEFGEGVDRMISEMERRLMSPPAWTASTSSVQVVLHHEAKAAIEEQVWLQLLAIPSLTPIERLALVMTRRAGSVAKRELKRAMPDGDIDALVAGLSARNLLTRRGQRGGARYVLSPEVVLRAGGGGVEAQERKRQRLLDEVEQRGSLSTSEGAQITGEDVRRTRDMLNDLVRAGLLRAEGNTSGRRYYPSRQKL